MANRPINVTLLEGDFAVLSLLGFPLGLTIQLQQSNLNLADALWTALWTAKSSKGGQIMPPIFACHLQRTNLNHFNRTMMNR